MYRRIVAGVLFMASFLWKVLDIFGRMEILFSADTKIGHIQGLAMKSGISVDIAIWLLLALTVLFLWPSLWRRPWGALQRQRPSDAVPSYTGAPMSAAEIVMKRELIKPFIMERLNSGQSVTSSEALVYFNRRLLESGSKYQIQSQELEQLAGTVLEGNTFARGGGVSAIGSRGLTAEKNVFVRGVGMNLDDSENATLKKNKFGGNDQA